MQVSSHNGIQNLYTQKLSKDEVKQLKDVIDENINKYTFTDFSTTNVSNQELSNGEKILKNSQEFQNFLYKNGIDGVSVKRISELNFTAPSFLDVKA